MGVRKKKMKGKRKGRSRNHLQILEKELEEKGHKLKKTKIYVLKPPSILYFSKYQRLREN